MSDRGIYRQTVDIRIGGPPCGPRNSLQASWAPGNEFVDVAEIVAQEAGGLSIWFLPEVSSADREDVMNFYARNGWSLEVTK